MLKIGSHVSMSGKEMFLGSVKEALTYNANTFMIYTGAPQNTRRKDIKDLNIEAGQALMKEHNIDEFFVHAPYIINLANAVKPEVFELAVKFLSVELERTHALGSKILILHPGSHVGSGVKTGLNQIIKGLNLVLTKDTPVKIALETMSGKGSELGCSFNELQQIFEGVIYNEKLGICFDTCHVSDSGYNLITNYDETMDKFNSILGFDKIQVFHINDSKNICGSRKDRHENIGFGQIGFDPIYKVITDKRFETIPKILETPYIPSELNSKKSYPPYKYEIEMIRNGSFCPNLKQQILKEQEL